MEVEGWIVLLWWARKALWRGYFRAEAWMKWWMKLFSFALDGNLGLSLFFTNTKNNRMIFFCLLLHTLKSFFRVCDEKQDYRAVYLQVCWILSCILPFKMAVQMYTHWRTHNLGGRRPFLSDSRICSFKKVKKLPVVF